MPHSRFKKAAAIHDVDCLEFMRNWKGRKADVVVTSPPYNIGKGYRQYNDNMDYEDYLEWTGRWAGEGVHSILAKDGSFFLNIGYTAKYPSIPYDVLGVLKDRFVLQNVIHWIKSVSVPELDFTAGHFKPLNTDRFINQCHEFIFHFTKTGRVSLDKQSIGVEYADKSNIKRWNHGRTKRDRGNVWFIPYTTKNGSLDHPCAFPVGLPEMCIKLHGIRRDMRVYDPFMGSGSTAVACQKLDVDCVGTEIDPEYVDLTHRRLGDKECVICV